jgi:hypothetical protein
MPTTSWILEGAQDRYWRNTEVQEHNPPPPPIVCPHCGVQFLSYDQLQAHTAGLRHPIDLPTLLLRQSPLARETVVRQRIGRDEIATSFTTDCTVTINGCSRDCPLGGLPAVLASTMSGVVEVSLQNASTASAVPTSTSYRLEYCIAAEADLALCDDLFVSGLAVPQPTMADVDAFLRRSPGNEAAREYAGALGDYVVGVLLKEQAHSRGVNGGFEKYHDKFMSSLNVLIGFSRPVARAVSTVIQFGLNAWRNLRPPPELGSVAVAAGFLGRIAGFGTEAAVLAGGLGCRPICPVDSVTDRILRAAELMALGDMAAGVVVLDGLPRGTPIGEHDQAKIDVMAAFAALQEERFDAARRYLRRLYHDARFGKWAQGEMEELSL